MTKVNCLSYVSHAVIKYADQSNTSEKGFILAYVSKDTVHRGREMGKV